MSTEVNEWLHPGAFLCRETGHGRHVLGGETSLSGVQCGNCDEPFVTLLELDLTDPLLRGGWCGLSRLPLLFCPRCMTFEEGLAYQLHETDGIVWLREGNGNSPGWKRAWEEECPAGHSEACMCSLRVISPEVEAILLKVNDGEELIRGELESLAAQSIGHASVAECGYPYLRANSQVGGIPYLPQGYSAPSCMYCEECGLPPRMAFIACLVNDWRQAIRVIYDGVYVEYWGCLACGTIYAEQRAT